MYKQAIVNNLIKLASEDREQDLRDMYKAFDTLDNVEIHNTSEAKRMADKGRNLATSSGIGLGVGLGGSAGLLGSRFLNKKLGLTGHKATAVNALGFLGGSALGGLGGYYGGNALGKYMFTPDLRDAHDAYRLLPKGHIIPPGAKGAPLEKG